jgi:hypothetical protein
VGRWPAMARRRRSSGAVVAGAPAGFRVSGGAVVVRPDEAETMVVAARPGVASGGRGKRPEVAAH